MLGTPDETIWPGVSQLPDYTSRFPRWEATDISDVLPSFDEDAKDLLSVRENQHLSRESERVFFLHVFFFYVFRKC